MTFIMESTVEGQFSLFFMREILKFTFQKPFPSAQQLRKDRPCAKELQLSTALSGMEQRTIRSKYHHLKFEFFNSGTKEGSDSFL